jgi:predicted DNA-binding antitoxin AbrB/MazE fold protein
MKTLTQSAQVAKLIKKVALQNGMKVKASSSNYSMGCSVTIKVLKGSDKDLEKLKDYSDQFKYGKFDGMNDIYDNTNVLLLRGYSSNKISFY